MCQGGLPYSGDIFDQEMSTGEKRHDRQPHGLGLAPNDAFDRGLEQLNFFRRRYSYCVSTGCAKVSHRLFLAILHGVSPPDYDENS
jgi:hypothetical protein